MYKRQLLISANPTYPRLQITAVPYKNPAVPSNFTMTLRKYLEGALIDSISQVDNDRIVEFTFTTRDELGDTQHLKLIVEIMARHSNVSLVNQETGKIIDTIKHVGSDQNRVRLLLPGALFRMPPKQERTNPYLPNQHYPKLFSQFQGDQAGLAKALQHQYQGFGKMCIRDRRERPSPGPGSRAWRCLGQRSVRNVTSPFSSSAPFQRPQLRG